MNFTTYCDDTNALCVKRNFFKYSREVVKIRSSVFNEVSPLFEWCRSKNRHMFKRD